jgi:tRNA G10  N-methylase Trm11
MKTYLHLSEVQEMELPAQFRGDDVRFSESLAEYFIQQYSQPGDVVFDPFAGFGTTLRVAEKLNRIPYGLEFDMRRVEYIRTFLRHTDNLIHGDARRLGEYPLPQFDFLLTSPPYMSKNDREDPFSAYTLPGSGYEAYLHDLQQIFVQIRKFMKPGARAVIEASNLKGESGVTTLAWDIAKAVGQVLVFEGEMVIEWEESYGYGYDHSYALIFSRSETFSEVDA